MVERVRQLDPSAADPGVVAPAHLERGIGRQLEPRLVEPPIARPHRARHHQRGRPAAAFGQPAIVQQLVEADGSGHGSNGSAGRRGTSTPLRALTGHDRPIDPDPPRRACRVHRPRLLRSRSARAGADAAVASVPQPSPPVALPVPQPVYDDWMDAPRTPGDWSYRSQGTGSAALYATPGREARFALTCDPQARAITLSRGADASGSTTMRDTHRDPGSRSGRPAGNRRGRDRDLAGKRSAALGDGVQQGAFRGRD